ncbi:GntR family transcriptional regulator [Sphingopyxis panaciterrulae]|uniref:GntR family transcriptional regulator n=1 Tax=Sphingopyxis panaciterrulae TaxID=462372 RepID=A0A7W9B6B3_9SPHN|nr:GntR family transcriptional regulator [Sphingopyxis panaciterrulae]MBB5707075.1 GntR family transcriptional regulator [Sphingopyxis panaciterrulae]
MTVNSSEVVRDSIKALRYHQVYSILRGWIFDGTYPAGAKLPPEGELCERLGVSRITSRKALDLLVSEGLVRRVQGKGTFVASELNGAPTVGDMEQLIHRVARASSRSKVVDVKIREVIGDPDICRDLDIDEGGKVREIGFVRTLDGKPTGYRQSYLPLDVAPGITPDEIRRKPMLQVFEDHGVRISAADTLVGACLADTQKAMILDTTVGVPLVRIRLILLDEDKRPIERSTRYYLADYYEHHLYLTRSAGLNASNLSI